MADQIVAPALAPAEPESLLARAEQFITMFYGENNLGPPDERLAEVRDEIDRTGTYWHTPAEVEFGARVGWRHSAKCIGRLYWNSLRVRDRRDVTSAKDVAGECVEHLYEATNGGKIRPTVTVFAPDKPGRPGPRILSSQLIRYAGYETSYGQVFGDPANIHLTRMAHILGWPGGRPATRMDVLPMLIQEPGGTPTIHKLPPDAVLEVPLEHPGYKWFANLGLRWHAVPVISDMYLDVGGVRYPAAPFNGWYMGTEIGSRNLGDEDRYGMMRPVAEKMGFPTSTDLSLWKDRALTELNAAVLWSFARAGVTISDHHTESDRFLRHIEREAKHGRDCPADWSWIVPPQASSACPVFHRKYQDFDVSPNFYRHPAPGVALATNHRHAPVRERTSEHGRGGTHEEDQLVGLIG